LKISQHFELADLVILWQEIGVLQGKMFEGFSIYLHWLIFGFLATHCILARITLQAS